MLLRLMKHPLFRGSSNNFLANAIVAPSFQILRQFSTEGISTELETEYKEEVDEILNKYEEKRKRKQNAKSITVTYQHPKDFPKYNATVSTRRRIMAHDEEEVCDVGDLVRIVPCPPKSAKKRHRIIDIIRKTPKFDFEKLTKFQEGLLPPNSK